MKVYFEKLVVPINDGLFAPFIKRVGGRVLLQLCTCPHYKAYEALNCRVAVCEFERVKKLNLTKPPRTL